MYFCGRVNVNEADFFFMQQPQLRTISYIFLMGVSFGLKLIPLVIEWYRITVNIFTHSAMDSVLQHAGLAGILFILYEGFILFGELDHSEDSISPLELSEKVVADITHQSTRTKLESQEEPQTKIRRNGGERAPSDIIFEPSISVKDRAAIFSSLSTRKSNQRKKNEVVSQYIDRENNLASNDSFGAKLTYQTVNDFGNESQCQQFSIQKNLNLERKDSLPEPAHVDIVCEFKQGLSVLGYEKSSLEHGKEISLTLLDEEPLCSMDDCNSVSSTEVTLQEDSLILEPINSRTNIGISSASVTHLPLPILSSSILDDFDFKEIDCESMEIQMLDLEKPLPAVTELLGNAPAAEFTIINAHEKQENRHPSGPINLDFGAFSLPHLSTVGRRSPPTVSQESQELPVPSVQSKMSRDSAIFIPQKKYLPLIPEQDVYLDFSNQQLTKFPVDEVEDAGMTHLSLEKNKISFIPSFVVSFLKFVKVLNMSNNCLISVPAEMEQMNSLEFLYLRNNEIEDLPLTLGRLTKLKILDLGSNQLSVIGIKSFMQIIELSTA
jgi:hypothetical protein